MNVERAIRKIEMIDAKIRPLLERANAIQASSAIGQPPPVLGQTLDKIITLQAQQAKIWNEELRSKLVEGRTLWQRAVTSNLPVVRFGAETHLDFTGADIRRLLQAGEV